MKKQPFLYGKRSIALSLDLLLVIAANASIPISHKNPLNLISSKYIHQTDTSKINLSKEQVLKIAKDAYLYGLPVVFTDFTRQASGQLSNIFSHGHKFPDHTSRWVVAPNNDTNYSSAFLDLGEDAIVLNIPDTKGRYFVVPLMDAWTNVFASFGKRNTGTQAQKYLITGPKWKGIVPAGLKQVKSPTDLVWVIGRIQVNSTEDQANFVSKIQDQFTLTTLKNYGKNSISKAGTPAVTYKTPLPLKAVQNHEFTVVKAIQTLPIVAYFNYLNELLVKNPPLPADAPVIAEFKKIGIQAGGKFDLTAFDQQTQDALNALPGQVYKAFDVTRQSVENAKPANGAKIGDYKTDYTLRAIVAYKGLGALTPEEATYIGYNTDADKNPLNGKNTYVIHFEKGKLPPSTAFWSLTMYDQERYLVDNPIRRYAIGDRNPLKYNTDGSLDIYIQHEKPGTEKESNWLPAPDADFNVTLRIYVPKEAYLKDKNTWANPPLKKVKSDI